MFRFAYPWILAALPVVLAAMILLHRRLLRNAPRLRFSSIESVRRAGPPRRPFIRHLPAILRMAAVTLLLLALARPQSGTRDVRVRAEGVDILIAMDVSGSMQAIDFEPNNRLDAAKTVAAEFIRGRESDQLGLVVFAAVSFVQCPLTLDADVLLGLLDEIRIGMVEDGTAIGMAIVNCANRLEASEAKSKVAILLTDGVNNTGRIDPITAAELARAVGVRVYTIGVGSRGEALFPVRDPVFGTRYVRRPVEIDEETLRKIADGTGGRYFRATDTEALRTIFREIGEMEKTEVTSKEYVNYYDLYDRFAIPAALLLLAEALLGSVILRRIL
ncbi:MAG: VWA domain-containing protein [Candidatus Eisenbacteria bacterium]|nr:VWA domain-containing protein [Candidatus Eisenbacteria bacterium]